MVPSRVIFYEKSDLLVTITVRAKTLNRDIVLESQNKFLENNPI